MEEQQKMHSELVRELGLEVPDLVSKQEILLYIETALSRLLVQEPERFFQLMYRLDIEEQQLNLALNNENGILRVAELVYQRQLAKIRARQEHAGKDTPDAELDW